MIDLKMISQLMSPANMQMVNELPKFFMQWVDFMNALRRQLTGIDVKLDEINATTRMILQTVTPEMLSEDTHLKAVAMSADDPRNGEQHGR